MSFGYKCIPFTLRLLFARILSFSQSSEYIKVNGSVLQTNALSTRRQLSVFHWKCELNLLLQICSFLLKYFQAQILLIFFLKKKE